MSRETIGRYEIQSEIGRGGMAVVYLAYDPSFRRNVAIKLVSVNRHESFIFRERFEREAQTIARIEHPAIVPVYDFGEQDNQPYLVMRYMPGGAVTNKIKEGPLTLKHASQIISQIAPALDAVHAQGVVHRDLKPANILLDSFGNAAISDFGIAYLTAVTSDLTGSAIIGTPSYMSPEQVRGDTDLDGRSDIYALGVILFEMLTGSGPFRAATPLSIALKHLNEPVPSIQTHRPDLPEAVRWILNKALAKDRESRYDSASDFARELKEIADTFQETDSPSPVVAKLPSGREAATEIDASESALPSIHSSASLGSEAVQPTPLLTESAARPQRSVLLRIAAIAGLLFFLVAVCGSLGLLGAWARFGLPVFFPVQNPTVAPSLTASPTESFQPAILFADDFSDPNSGWPTNQDSQSEYGYQSSSYRILALGSNSKPWVSTDRVYDNLSLYVDARAVSGSASGSYGLLCRIQEDQQNFYYFVVTNQGEYAMGKYKNSQFQPFFPEGLQPSNAINQGDQVNRLRVDCIGNSLRFYANDILLAEVTDTDFTSGLSGMTAESLTDQGYEVLFDNFLITEASQ